MARALTYDEEQLYLRLVDAAGDHVRGVLGVGGSGPDAADVRAALAPEQYRALERLARGARTDEFGGVRYRRGPGPIRPSRARALKTGLQAVMAAQVYDAAPPPQGEMSEADRHLDRGLRTAFTEQELGSFMERNGVRRPLMFRAVRDRGADTHVYAVAADALVSDIAKRTSMSKRDVMQQLLQTPPDKRIDLAAGMLSGRASGMPAAQREYARNAMANQMRGRFGGLGRTGASFDQIGQRWKRLPRWMKILVGVVVITNPSCIPVLLALRATRAIQRSQRLGHRWMAAHHAHSAVRDADRSLARELRSVRAVGQPVVGRHAPAPGRQAPPGTQVSTPSHVPGQVGQLDWGTQQAWTAQHQLNQRLNGPPQVQPPWPPGYDAPIPGTTQAPNQQPGLDPSTQPVPTAASQAGPQRTGQPVAAGLDEPTQPVAAGSDGPTQRPEEAGVRFQWPAELAWPGDGVQASGGTDPGSTAGWNAATTGMVPPQPGNPNAAETAPSARSGSTTRGRTNGPTQRGE
jgi:hypothetical protein